MMCAIARKSVEMRAKMRVNACKNACQNACKFACDNDYTILRSDERKENIRPDSSLYLISSRCNSRQARNEKQKRNYQQLLTFILM